MPGLTAPAHGSPPQRQLQRPQPWQPLRPWRRWPPRQSQAPPSARLFACQPTSGQLAATPQAPSSARPRDVSGTHAVHSRSSTHPSATAAARARAAAFSACAQRADGQREGLLGCAQLAEAGTGVSGRGRRRAGGANEVRTFIARSFSRSEFTPPRAACHVVGAGADAVGAGAGAGAGAARAIGRRDLAGPGPGLPGPRGPGPGPEPARCCLAGGPGPGSICPRGGSRGRPCSCQCG